MTERDFAAPQYRDPSYGTFGCRQVSIRVFLTVLSMVRIPPLCPTNQRVTTTKGATPLDTVPLVNDRNPRSVLRYFPSERCCN